MQHFLKKTGWVLITAISMGYLESSVVVYIREIYYPDGFSFPMKFIDDRIMITEFFREIATMVMLIGIAVISGKKAIDRFAYFIFAFAIWDIFYYVFLYLLLEWPANLLTWDVLFFIPTTWIGPVLAPIINSITMIILSMAIIIISSGNRKCISGKWVWTLLIVGSFIVIFSYVLDYTSYMSGKFSLGQIYGMRYTQEMMVYATGYIPIKFNWWLFLSGVFLHLLAIGLLLKNNLKKRC